ncbi:hypothetical protein EH223_03505 [candidate division KSB1 bacterium]|nr:hypothetical protein [candidate division KSB1 bacterium]RQW05889.1 MAG: hypothetical protein EH223_03505 [candidate division KSB1 bacterium]
MQAFYKFVTFRIVILGSSTAAGTGPSRSDSAWVNRYRRYVKNINSTARVNQSCCWRIHHLSQNAG